MHRERVAPREAARAPALSAVFHALAHPTRRALVSRLAAGPASVSELAAPHDIALPTLLQHLAVLEEAGLARSHKEGRVRTVRGTTGALEEAGGWMAEQLGMWTARLDQLDEYLGELKRKESD